MKKKHLLVKIMRITFLQLAIGLSLLGSAIAHEGKAQAILSDKVSLDLQDVKLSVLFKKLEKQYHVNFIYSSLLIGSNRRVTVSVSDKPLSAVLNGILKPLNLTYEATKDDIVISPAPDSPASPGQIQAYTVNGLQGRMVNGTVTDEKGVTLPGATVQVIGTQRGTVTNAEGKFTIEVENENDSLAVSFVGYQTKRVRVGSSNNLNIRLLPNASTSLQEVVVVGYGTQRKESLTSAVSSVNSEEIVTTKNENVENMLTGKVPGLRVVQNTSEPGTFDNAFDIRGLGSPLIVIDGIPRDNIARLNPNDIESISVLKDASAAVYGVRAANGVVLITTKRGKKGTLSLNYSGTQGWQVPSGLPESVDAIGYMTLFNEKEMHNVNGGHIGFTEADFEPYRNGTKTSTDWYTPVIKDVVPQSQHNLSATGGSDNINYFVSLGYTGQDGFLRSGDLNYKRYNVRSNVSSNITKNLSVDLNLNAIMDNKQQPYQDAVWIIRSFWRQLPTQSIYANDNPNYLLNPQVDGTNPVSMSNDDIDGYKSFNNKWFQSSVSLNYKIPYIEGLEAKGLFSYDYNMADNKLYQKEYTQYTYNANDDTYNPVMQQSPSNVRREYYSRPSTLSQISLNYNRVFAGVHNVGALLLYEESAHSIDNFYAQRDLSLPVDQLLAGNSLNQQGYMNVDSLYKRTNKGLVGRVTYNYKSKYLAEFSFRNDGSSKFARSRQWGFFPSGSVGWRISEEDFWKKSQALSFIDNLKLRASYGKLGDDAASSYQFITGYVYPASGEYNRLPPGSVFNGTFVNSLESTGLPNPNITWFVSKTLDIGVDLEAWKGLLGITADFFRRNRTGLLATRSLSLPDVVGADLPEENLNGDRTQGIDLELDHRYNIGDFRYYLKGSFSFTRTRNTYVERARAGNSYENWRNNSNNRYNDAWWGYSAGGRYQSYDDIVNSPVYVSRSTLPGDYAYEDWNGDGQISDLDWHPIAYNGIPRINYGLTLGGEYKGFDLNMLFQGTGMANVSYIEQLREPLWGGGSALEQFMDRWHPTDPTADPYDPNTTWIPGHFAYTGTLPDENSEFNIQNASYLRLKSLELGYTLPGKITAKVGVKNARIYINGYNIFTVTKLKYVDPEHPSSSWGYLYPLNKTYSLGLNVQF